LAQQTGVKAARLSAIIKPSEEEKIKVQARELCKHDLYYLAKEVLGFKKLTEDCHAGMVRDIDTPNYKFKLLLWPRGHYKCLSGDSEIYTPKGKIKLRDIRKGDVVYGIGEYLEVTTSLVCEVAQTTKQKVFKVVTQSGFSLKSSLEHKYITVEGYKELKDLQVGDHIATPRDLQLELKDSLTDSEVELLALAIAEGSLSSGNCSISSGSK